MKYLLSLLFVLLLLGPVTGKPKPNILFIMADDMGYADAGCYGQREIKTPQIDRLASEGMLFTQCYAGAPVCAPSRSVLLTGLHAGHTRVRGNTGKGGVVGLAGRPGRVPLEDEDITVAEILRDAGYDTAAAGKWGLGEPGTSGVPNKQGFDQWFGYLNQKRAHSYYPEYLWSNDQKLELEGNKYGKKRTYSHDLITEFALTFLNGDADKPFFLYVPYCIPHDRFEIPDLGIYEDKPWKQQEKTYAAMITRMDRDIGRLLDKLEAKGLAENTIVFFCSDNGAANRYEGRFDSSGMLRGRKRDMYEGGIRTPMIVRWPNRISRGSVSDVVWSFTDFLATAADLAGVEAPPNDGVSLVSVLTGWQDRLPDRYLYWEFFEGGFKQAARWKNWKVIRPRPDADLQLFNLAKDLGEAKDVAAENPDMVQQFEAYLNTARTESTAWPVNPKK